MAAFLRDPITHYLALACAIFTTLLTIFQICQHLRNYTEPVFQRYTIRILFMVPCYAVASYLALKWREQSLYFETPRDCYEAWVIYNFMSLCMAYVGGPGAVVVQSEGKVIEPSWILCTCCWAPIPVNGFFLRRCKQGTLQFVILKPFLAIVTLVLFVVGKYNVSDWSWDEGYVYIAFVYNVCYTVALFWMLLFYVGCEELLHPYNPLLKFVCFKAVIFLTFWQSMVVSFLAPKFSLSPSDSEALMNWLIVIEMMFAAVGMFFAFPYSEYKIGGGSEGWSWGAFRHAISLSDVTSDIMHVFNPSYQTYVLYTDGGPAQNVKKKKYRGRGQKILDASDFVGFFSQKNAPKRKTQQMWPDLADTSMDEDGVTWMMPKKDPNNLKSLITKIPGQLINRPLGWIPKITEKERNQAELLDSESDADYDEENVHDNTLTEMGNPFQRRRGVRLGSDSDSGDDRGSMGSGAAEDYGDEGKALLGGQGPSHSSSWNHLSSMSKEEKMFDDLARSSKRRHMGTDTMFLAAVYGTPVPGMAVSSRGAGPSRAAGADDEALFDSLAARSPAPAPAGLEQEMGVLSTSKADESDDEADDCSPPHDSSAVGSSSSSPRGSVRPGCEEDNSDTAASNVPALYATTTTAISAAAAAAARDEQQQQEQEQESANAAADGEPGTSCSEDEESYSSCAQREGSVDPAQPELRSSSGEALDAGSRSSDTDAAVCKTQLAGGLNAKDRHDDEVQASGSCGSASARSEVLVEQVGEGASLSDIGSIEAENEGQRDLVEGDQWELTSEPKQESERAGSPAPSKADSWETASACSEKADSSAPSKDYRWESPDANFQKADSSAPDEKEDSSAPDEKADSSASSKDDRWESPDVNFQSTGKAGSSALSREGSWETPSVNFESAGQADISAASAEESMDTADSHAPVDKAGSEAKPSAGPSS